MHAKKRRRGKGFESTPLVCNEEMEIAMAISTKGSSGDEAAGGATLCGSSMVLARSDNGVAGDGTDADDGEARCC